jgi:hypothetical protein
METLTQISRDAASRVIGELQEKNAELREQLAQAHSAIAAKDAALKEMLDCINDYNGHGCPGFRDRALAYLAIHNCKATLALTPSDALKTVREALEAVFTAVSQAEEVVEGMVDVESQQAGSVALVPIYKVYPNIKAALATLGGGK